MIVKNLKKLFMKTFHEIYNKSFPLKEATMKERRMTANPWISKGIVKSYKHQFKLYKTFNYEKSE